MGIGNRLLDASITYSFDKTGYIRHAREFDPAGTDVSLSGRVALVTGANSGIGREISRQLAQRGARVYALCRNASRGANAVNALVREGVGDVRLQVVDLAVQRSIRAFAAAFDEPVVDMLVHNAGALLDTRTLSAEGYEVTAATHLWGPHLLTALMQPRLRAAQQARVIWVSSGGMYAKGLRLEQLGATEGPYDGVSAYAQAKRAQVVLSELWAAHLADTSITVNAMHPGWVDTPGVARALPRFYRRLGSRLRTVAQGADTAVWMAVAPSLAHVRGRFFFDRKARKTHLLPFTRERQRTRDALWRLAFASVDLSAPDEAQAESSPRSSFVMEAH